MKFEREKTDRRFKSLAASLCAEGQALLERRLCSPKTSSRYHVSSSPRHRGRTPDSGRKMAKDGLSFQSPSPATRLQEDPSPVSGGKGRKSSSPSPSDVGRDVESFSSRDPETFSKMIKTIKELQEHRRRLLNETNDLRTELSAARSDAATAMKRVAEAASSTSEQMAVMQAQHQRSAAKIEPLQAEVREAQGKDSSSGGSKMSLAASDDKNHELELRASRLERELSAKEGEVVRMEGDLSRALQENRALCSAISVLEDKVAELERGGGPSQDEFARAHILEQKVSELERMVAEQAFAEETSRGYEGLMEAMQELQGQQQRLLQENCELRRLSDNSDMDNIQRTLQQKEEELEVLLARHLGLQDEHDQLKKEHEALQRRVVFNPGAVSEAFPCPADFRQRSKSVFSEATSDATVDPLGMSVTDIEMPVDLSGDHVCLTDECLKQGDRSTPSQHKEIRVVLMPKDSNSQQKHRDGLEQRHGDSPAQRWRQSLQKLRDSPQQKWRETQQSQKDNQQQKLSNIAWDVVAASQKECPEQRDSFAPSSPSQPGLSALGAFGRSAGRNGVQTPSGALAIRVTQDPDGGPAIRVIQDPDEGQAARDTQDANGGPTIRVAPGPITQSHLVARIESQSKERLNRAVAECKATCRQVFEEEDTCASPDKPEDSMSYSEDKLNKAVSECQKAAKEAAEARQAQRTSKLVGQLTTGSPYSLLQNNTVVDEVVRKSSNGMGLNGLQQAESSLQHAKIMSVGDPLKYNA